MKKILLTLSAAIFLGAGCTGTTTTDFEIRTEEPAPTHSPEETSPSTCPTLLEACVAICAGEKPPGNPEICPALAGAGCDCEGVNPTTSTSTDTETEIELDTGKGVEANVTVETEVMAELTISMDSGNFYFKPTTIEAKPGQTVHVKITSNEGFHTFVLDEAGVKTTVKSGETITFTAPSTAGSYTFYCDVGSHQAMGMEGTLIVK